MKTMTLLDIQVLRRHQRLAAVIFMMILGSHEVKMESRQNYSKRTDSHRDLFKSGTLPLRSSKLFDLQPTEVSPAVNTVRPNLSISACVQGNSSDINQCLRQVLQILKPHLSRGIPQINIPPMDPLEIQNITFQQGSGAVRIVSEFRGVQIIGISNFFLTDLRTDISEQMLSFDMVFPKLSVAGSYELSGNIFLFMMAGKGDFYCDLVGAKAQGTSKLGVSKKDSSRRLYVKKMDISLAVDSIKVHLTNLFNGDPVLGTVINNFLNENSQDVFDEVRPQVELQVAELLSKLANVTLSAISKPQLDDTPLD